MTPTPKCPECGSNKISFNENEIYCSECGLLIEDSPIDIGKENPVQETAPPTDIFHPLAGSIIGPKRKK